MADLYTLSVLAFVIGLAALIYIKRKKIEIKYYLLFMWHTKRFRDSIERIVQRAPRLWKAVATIGVVICFYYMIQGVWLITNVAWYVATGAIKQPAIQLILPSPSAAGATGPGYILIPFWLWIITIAAILVPHELMHGIVARAEKIKLKSVGLLLFAIFPGAFVEPDEKALKRASVLSKLRVFAAGSFANFAVAAAVLVFVSFALWPAIAAPGIELVAVNASSPAAEAGLAPGMMISEINDKPITTTYNEYLAGKGYTWEELGQTEPNQTLAVRADDQLYNIVLGNISNSAYMGITYKPIFRFGGDFTFNMLLPLLTMIWLFSFAVGLMNILPLYPLDGGLMIEAITNKYAKKVSKQIVRGITLFVLLILIYSFVGPLWANP